MKSKNEFEELDEYLAGKLRLLDEVSPLNPQSMAEERQKFLALGAMMRATAVEKPNQPKVRGFQAWVLSLRRSRQSFSNVMAALVLALALILGSTGATVYAAQGSLPDQFLYPVKTLSEDTLLALTYSSETKLELTLDYSNQRLDEIAQMRSLGKMVPEATLLRTQEQLDAALKIAAEMNDQQLVQALEQIRQRAEVQSEQMLALMSGDPAAEADPALAQLQVRLRAQVQVAAEGEIDPAAFRLLVRAWSRERWRVAPPDMHQGTPEGPKGSDNGNQPSVTPGQYGPGEPNFNRPTATDPAPSPASRP